MRIYLNDGWKFTKEFTPDLCEADYANETLTEVRLPHTVAETAYNYFDETEYEMVSGYRKEFDAPKEWEDNHVFITFEGAAHRATVYLNGQKVYTHNCGYTAFSFEMNPYLRYDGKNVLVVELDSRESLNQPPFGNVIDYMTYGGIYRDVYMEIKPKVYIKDVDIKCDSLLDVTKIMNVEVKLSEEVGGFVIRQSLLDQDGHCIMHYSDITSLKTSYGVTDIVLWSPDDPRMYIFKTELLIDGEVRDVKLTKKGFREAIFKADGFYLNGKKMKLRGLNRHQSYPYVGYAMPERAQRRDARILKEELSVNMVRTSHYPQSHYFLDECDEIGLLVFTEIPGWQYIGDDQWKEQVLKNTKDMVLQYKHHPSVVLWGVRINESLDDDELYRKTNEIAHNLDEERQTGGVRYLKKSHLLEDVYTYNDFLHSGDNAGIEDRKKVTERKEKGYLISEFNGHMFPVKMFDKESVRLELALRTAKVMNDYYAKDDVAGGIGWCMFDYNTHKDFGSGDRICYHGAMDMFRNPKLSAYVYASQTDGKPVFELSSTMSIGEHPSSNLGTVYAFTNADVVKVYKNDEFVREYRPDYEKGMYKNLPHPPIAMDDFIGELLNKHEKYGQRTCEKIKELLLAVMKYGMGGLPFKYKRKMVWMMCTRFISMKKATELYGKYVANWGDKATTYRFEAVKDGEVVKVIEKKQDIKKKLRVTTDTALLVETNSYDVASVRICMCDEQGNLLPYYQEPVCLSTDGEIELIGPKIISLKGGCFGTYVKTTGKSGVGLLRVSTVDGLESELKFNVLT